MSIKQEVNAPLILTIGAVGGVLFVIIVFGLQAWWLWAEGGEMRSKTAAGGNVEMRQLHDEQRAHLARSGEIDGKMMIPIEIAMERIVESRGMLPSTQPAR